MNQPTPSSYAQQLVHRAVVARLRSAELAAETVKMARQVAETEEAVAGKLSRLAAQNPDHARQLRAMSQEARQRAIQERQWADRQDELGVRGCDEVA